MLLRVCRRVAWMTSDVNIAAANSLEQELLRLLARQGRRMPLPVFLASVMIAVLALGRVAPHLLAGWLALVLLVLLLRWLILGRLADLPISSDTRRLRIAVGLSALNGVTHGLSLFFFPALSELQRALQTLLLVGLCAGAIATTAGYLPLFLAYMAPVMAPLAAAWAWFQPDGKADWVDGATSFIIVVLGGLFVTLAADAFRLFRASFEIRLQQAELNRQLRQALEQAESANRAKTRFLAAASHDLRQPVHALSLFAAALEIRPLDPVSRDISQHMNQALQALSGRLDALLDVSKLDAGVVQARLAPLRLAPFLTRLHEEFLPLAHARSLQMSIDCSGDPVALTDQVLLGRLLGNLIDNAIKYTPAGFVRLSLLGQQGLAVLAVEDSGRGIAEAEHGRVFEEFYQIDNPERTQSKGLGLGLPIVRRLADLLGARLEMISAPGTGTSFYLLLEQQKHALEEAPQRMPPPDAIAARHIMVVDDESSVRLGMQSLLEGLGARVTLASGTAEALAAAKNERPDLLLVDFRLRGDDSGLDTVRELRRLYADLPAILISGDTAPDRLREATLANIALLHKPLPIAMLKQAVADSSAFQPGTYHGST